MMDVQFWNAGTRIVSEVAIVSGRIKGKVMVKGPLEEHDLPAKLNETLDPEEEERWSV
jgi:hypothetical protein